MAQSLIELFEIGEEVVALVGAGGKTTIAFTIGREALRRGRRTIVTTTTKLGAEQTSGFEVVPPQLGRVSASLDASGGCLVIAAREGHKATGVSPEWVDATRTAGIADLIVVEADGARRKMIKAPETYEPVVPASATLVIAVMSARALGGVIGEVAHRPERVAGLIGCETSDRLDAEGAAAVMASRRGGRKSVPEGARFVVAISAASGAHAEPARRVAGLLEPIPVVLLPSLGRESEFSTVR